MREWQRGLTRFSHPSNNATLSFSNGMLTEASAVVDKTVAPVAFRRLEQGTKRRSRVSLTTLEVISGNLAE
jgi:hypothetical protein